MSWMLLQVRQKIVEDADAALPADTRHVTLQNSLTPSGFAKNALGSVA
jgi:hypothetical protein